MSFSNSASAKKIWSLIGKSTSNNNDIQQTIVAIFNHAKEHGDVGAFDRLLELANAEDANITEHEKIYRMKQVSRIKTYIGEVFKIKMRDNGRFAPPNDWKTSFPRIDTDKLLPWYATKPKAEAPKAPKKAVEKLAAYVAKLDDKIMAACLQQYMSAQLEKDMIRMAADHARRAEEEKAKKAA